MPSGPPSDLSGFLLQGDYQTNLARIEQAKKLLEQYATMNEEARRKYQEYEQDLTRKIAEGDSARQELERLRNRNAPLAITAPPAANLQQVAPAVANAAHVQTGARFEQVPGHSRQSNQMGYSKIAYPSTLQAQTSQWTVQPQTHHKFYNRTGTTQEQPIQAATPSYTPYSESSSSQVERQTHHISTNQPHVVPNQVSQSVWHPPVSNPVTPTHRFSHAAQATQQEQQKRAPQNVRQGPTTVQQRQMPLNAHQRDTQGQERPQNVHQQAKVVQQQERPQNIHRQATVAQQQERPQNIHHQAAVVQQQGGLQNAHQQATVAQQADASRSTSISDSQAFASIAQNFRLIELLRTGFMRIKSSIPVNSYFPITNTPYFLMKHPNNSMSLIMPDGQGDYTFLDVQNLLAYTANMTHTTQAPGNTQESIVSQTVTAQAPNRAPLRESQETHLTLHSTPTAQSLPAQVQSQLAPSQPQPPTQSWPARPQIQPIQRELQPLQVQAQIQIQLQPPSERKPHSTQERTGAVPKDKLPQRTPGDVDKRHLARDILRALGIKRPRPVDTPESQSLEPAAKRYELQPGTSQGIQSVAIGESRPNQRTAGVATINGVWRVELNQPVTGAAPVVREPQRAQQTGQTHTVLGTQVIQPTQLTSSATPTAEIVEASRPIQPASTVEHPVNGPQTTHEPTLTLVSPLVTSPPASVVSMEVAEMASLSDEVDLVSASIVELPPSPEPTIKTVEESVLESPAVTVSVPMDIDHTISATVPHTVQTPPVTMVQNFDLQKSSDNTANKLDCLTIQEQANADHNRAPAQIGPEEDEIQVQDVREEEEGQIPSGSADETRGDDGAKSSMPKQPTQEEENKKPKTPLFLPSPSSSPRRSISPGQSSAPPPPDTDDFDEDISIKETIHVVAAKRGARRKSIHRRVLTKKQPFYILIPPPPPYVLKYKEQEVKQRMIKRKRSAMGSDDSRRRIQRTRASSREDTADPAVISALRDSTTRLTERRCKWNGCDVVLNSSQNLFLHLQQEHCMSDFTKKYILCYWTGCGDHVVISQIDEHLGTHTFFPLFCPYQDCEESFRAVKSLIRHSDSNHKGTPLKRTPKPFIPIVKEPRPTPVPSKVPAYMINSGLVRQESIPQYRHSVLAPWVYNNIAGPSLVTKRYNAAKGKPLEYEVVQGPSQQFSTSPSKPAKIRDVNDLASVEVSGMVSGGLVIWPPRKTKIRSSSEDVPESKIPEIVAIDGTKEERLQEEELFEGAIIGQAEIKSNDETFGKTSFNSSSMVHQASEEEAVESMLTEQ